MDLPKQYDPQEAQSRFLKFWDEHGYFHSRPDTRQPFTIVIPPPNVTGALHMGHALNNTLQDVLIRWRRMQGDNAEWMPGTDHAGIATQAVVERLIFQQEKKTRHDLGREELGQAHLAMEGQVRSPHPGPASPTRLLVRLGAHPLHARRHLRPRRPPDVLQHVQGRPDLPRQTPRQLGRPTANLRRR